MDARLLLDSLASRGIRVRPRDDALVVEPASTLTDGDRALLRQLKPELLALLAHPSARCAWCGDPADAAAPDAAGAPWCRSCRDAELRGQRNPAFLLRARSLRAAWAGAVFELGELAGFPALPYRPGRSVVPGEAGWRRFVAHHGVDDQRRVLDALRPVVDLLPQPPSRGEGRARNEDCA